MTTCKMILTQSGSCSTRKEGKGDVGGASGISSPVKAEAENKYYFPISITVKSAFSRNRDLRSCLFGVGSGNEICFRHAAFEGWQEVHVRMSG